mgnify:CR=1 FL=1
MSQQDLKMEGTAKTPQITLNTSEGYLCFQGRSIPENTYSFYQPINTWLDEYCLSPQELTTMDIRLEYFNTSSSKCLLDLLKKLEGLSKEGKAVQINWFFEKEDEDMQEAGEDYKAIIGLPFSIIEVDEL